MIRLLPRLNKYTIIKLCVVAAITVYIGGVQELQTACKTAIEPFKRLMTLAPGQSESINPTASTHEHTNSK